MIILASLFPKKYHCIIYSNKLVYLPVHVTGTFSVETLHLIRQPVSIRSQFLVSASLFPEKIPFN